MSSGIVCKVWNIKSESFAKGTKEQLRDSLGYILNDEKTEVQLETETINQLMRECKYVENDIKTFSGAFVGGNNVVNVDPIKAVEEMMQVKDFYGKHDGRAALHLLISLPEEESKIENASRLMQLCNDVLKEVFPNNQAVFAVHTNTDNLHIHAIINSVGLDGRKIHQDDKFIKNVLQPCINKYSKKYRFSENVKWGKEETKPKLSFVQIKMILRDEIDQAIEKANSFEEFQEILKMEGIDVRVGKNISLKLASMDKAVRTHNLGSNYTRDAIVQRLETKKDRFEKISVGSYVVKRQQENIFVPYIFEMKKYKDMTSEQKKEVVHQLKLGRNPWRESKKMNWQLNNIANELNTEERIRGYIEFYSTDGTIQGAMDGIVNAKKQIAHDKKMVTYAKNKYNPILKIFEEMKKIERKAYLYEHQHIEEFRTEFEQYRDLTRRLKTGYGKEVFEVASFLQECDERLLYAHAQLNELSNEYRELKKYGINKGQVVNASNDFINTLGYFEKKSEEKTGSFEADAFYISSCTSDVVVRIIKTLGVDTYGKVMEEYNLSVLDSKGTVIDEVSNLSAYDKEFNSELKRIQKQYDLSECRRFETFQRAGEYINTDSKREENKPVLYKKRKENKNFSFTQSINHISENKPICVVIDSNDPSFIALSSKEGDQLKIIIMDQKHNVKESVHVPLVKERNSGGYMKLTALQKKYGFSDNVTEFNDLEEVHNYINEGKKQEDAVKQQRK
ncbi:MAG: relaxase/mobilization nuclease domain-containing protein [Lachnospiraceae bacterium]|nr:relaxase/mobilization nuclease domain-containing protein [Lachnospiraceae bacterium]